MMGKPRIITQTLVSARYQLPISKSPTPKAHTDMILKISAKTEGSKTTIIITSTGQHSTRAGTAAVLILLQQLPPVWAASTHLGNICHQNCRPGHFEPQTTAGQYHDAHGLGQFSTILDIQPLRTHRATPRYLKASRRARSGPGPPCQEKSQWHCRAATAEPPTQHMPLPSLDHVTVHFCHKTMAGMYFLKQNFNWPNSWRLFSCTDRPRHQPLARRIWVQLTAVLPNTPPFDSTHPISQLMSRDRQVPGTPTVWSTISAPGGKMKVAYLTLTLQD